MDSAAEVLPGWAAVVRRRALAHELELVLDSADDGDPELERTRGAFISSITLGNTIRAEFRALRALGRGVLYDPEGLCEHEFPRTTAHLRELCWQCREPWAGSLLHVCGARAREQARLTQQAEAARTRAAALEARRDQERAALAAQRAKERAALEEERRLVAAERTARLSNQRNERRARKKAQESATRAAKGDAREAPGGCRHEVFAPAPKAPRR